MLRGRHQCGVVLIVAAPNSTLRLLEHKALASSEAEFWRATPHTLPKPHGERLMENVIRTLIMHPSEDIGNS